MWKQHEWVFAFTAELVAASTSTLQPESDFVQSAAHQQWDRLADENPAIVARRWASKSGLLGASPPCTRTMLIWLSECAEALRRQQPSLSRNVANELAPLQWDMHPEMDPVMAAMHWISSHPRGRRFMLSIWLRRLAARRFVRWLGSCESSSTSAAATALVTHPALSWHSRYCQCDEGSEVYPVVDAVGGAGGNGERMPSVQQLGMASFQGRHVTGIATRLFG